MLGALSLTPAVRSGARRTLARWLQLPIGQSVAMTANRRVRRCLVVAVVGATNCKPGSGDQTSYLATTPAAVTYIRWTEAGSELSGLLTNARLAGAHSDRVSVAEDDITGLRDEDRVTFTIGGSRCGRSRGCPMPRSEPPQDLAAVVRLRWSVRRTGSKVGRAQCREARPAPAASAAGIGAGVVRRPVRGLTGPRFQRWAQSGHKMGWYRPPRNLTA